MKMTDLMNGWFAFEVYRCRLVSDVRQHVLQHTVRVLAHFDGNNHTVARQAKSEEEEGGEGEDNCNLLLGASLVVVVATVELQLPQQYYFARASQIMTHTCMHSWPTTRVTLSRPVMMSLCCLMIDRDTRIEFGCV